VIDAAAGQYLMDATTHLMAIIRKIEMGCWYGEVAYDDVNGGANREVSLDAYVIELAQALEETFPGVAIEVNKHAPGSRVCVEYSEDEGVLSTEDSTALLATIRRLSKRVWTHGAWRGRSTTANPEH
jgi:hypothetical protein